MASSIQSTNRAGPQRGRALRFAWAPGLSGLDALGLDGADGLFGDVPLADAIPLGPGDALFRGDSSTAVAGERARFPLPGTPRVPGGPPVGRPTGAGTGWLVVERWRGAPLGPLLGARFSRPRSASFAERRWNLLCHLRAEGVGTPEPLCVGARGTGLVSRDSFLITRELEDFTSLPAWLREERPPAERRLGLESLRAAVGKLLLAGVELPELEPRQLFLSRISAGCDEASSMGPRVRRLPSVVLTETPGARLLGRLSSQQMAAILDRLDDGSLELSSRERIRVFAGATAPLAAETRTAVRRAHGGRRGP